MHLVFYYPSLWICGCPIWTTHRPTKLFGQIIMKAEPVSVLIDVEIIPFFAHAQEQKYNENLYQCYLRI